MNKPELTPTRIQIAFAIAIIADLVQIPLTLAEGTGLGFIVGEFADFVMDCVVFGITCILLGFHVALLPSALLEIIPGLDLVPTWTGCVAFVVWQRRKEEDGDCQPSRISSMIDVTPLKTVKESLAKLLPSSLTNTANDDSFSRQIDQLERKFHAGAITYEEFEARVLKLTDEHINAD